MGRKLKLIYVAGSNRSGSTLLDRLLGQIPGFWSLGELLPRLDLVIGGGAVCGCGQVVSECTFWNKVLVKFRQSSTLRDDIVRRFVQDVKPSLITKRSKMQSTEYVDMLSLLYSSIQEVAQADVLVDSSKGPWFLDLLLRIPDLDIHVIHLVRDPRAVTHSWSKRKKEVVAGRFMDTWPVLKVAFSWLTTNLRMESFRNKYKSNTTFIRYEDFASNPLAVLSSFVNGYAPEYRQALFRFISQEGAIVRVNHTAGGNPMRVSQGNMQIKPDILWEQFLPWHKAFLVSFVTWPLMLRYGYVKGLQRSTASSVMSSLRRGIK